MQRIKKLLKADKQQREHNSGLKAAHKDPVSVTEIKSISIIRSVCYGQNIK